MIRNDYLSKLIGYNTSRKYLTNDTILTGKVRNIDPYGRLIIELPDKREMIFAHKEIEYVF
jgi:sRNA-binding regulator protein Hfq